MERKLKGRGRAVANGLLEGSDPVKIRGTWVDAHLRVVVPLLR